jgi:hypothetical protein
MDLAFQVKNTTEAVQNLPSLLRAIYELVTTPGGAVLLVLLFLGLLANRGFFSRVFDMFEHKERRRLEQINEYVLSHDAADPETIKVVKDLRDAHYFKVATGIYAENRTRSAFIKLHQTSSHCIAWKHIERARPYMEIAEDQTITIRDFNFIEKLGYWYNLCVAILSLLFAVLLIVAFLLSDTKNITSLESSFGSSLFLLVLAVVMFIENLPVHAAKRIANELQRLRDCSSAK